MNDIKLPEEKNIEPARSSFRKHFRFFLVIALLCVSFYGGVFYSQHKSAKTNKTDIIQNLLLESHDKNQPGDVDSDLFWEAWNLVTEKYVDPSKVDKNKMLYGAIELRHAPFLWWIKDLAAPDRLLSAVHIPFVEPPGIPVLTLIMGASMFIQQKMSPPPGDPAQARMMMILPLVFTFMFINFPAGLVLYWLTNNVLSMAQQYYIQRKTA